VNATNKLHILVSQPLVFDVTSMDVIHSFWVPDLYGKIDANPGRINRITFKANQAGEYRSVCAELCGAGHSGMLFRVQAQTQSDFQQWLQQQASGGGATAPAAPAPAGQTPAPAAPAPAGAPPAAQAGAAGNPQVGAGLGAQKGCGACHTVPGIQGANGAIGPN